MSPNTLDPTLGAELSAVAESCGCELLEASFHGAVLRLVIDRPEGISHSDCEAVSRQASALLDVSDFGRGRYVLEVSSPGLDRRLYGPRDYQRFLGRLTRVTFLSPETKNKRTVVGRLQAYHPEDGGRISVVEPEGNQHTIALSDLEAARLEVEL